MIFIFGRAFTQFTDSYHIKFPKACECLEKDKEVLFSFYDFTAQHSPHLRTTNPIESTFATVRLRNPSDQRLRFTKSAWRPRNIGTGSSASN